MKITNITFKTAYYFLISTVLLVSLTAGLSGQAIADSPRSRYSLDISDAEVTFSVKVLGLITVTGQFEQVEGGLLFTESCGTSSIAFRVQAASVNTSDTLIDNMIRGPSLLNSAQHPVITFNSSQVTGGTNGPETVTGVLSLNGVQHNVNFTITPENGQLIYTGKPQTYRANAYINRSDFGIPSPMIGTSNRIRIQVSLTIRQSELILATAKIQEATL
ncbi:MAG: YceI family protein [Gammaproteobacteria bacterium]|nr:YceI family protein [Gammaproteobacteria bacterium]